MNPHTEEQLIAQAQATESTHRVNGNKAWVYGNYTVTYDYIFDRYTVRHTPITYTLTPPSSDWTHEITTGEFYTFRVYPLSTGGEVRVPINDAAIEAYELGKDDDGLWAWEWMAQWLTEQEAQESEGEEARRLL